MKPWLETWRIDPEQQSFALALQDEEGVLEFADSPRARLAAAAPKLVQALLAVEWNEDRQWLEKQWCPCCRARRGFSEYEGDGVSRTELYDHNPGCVVDAALAAAGLVTAAERNVARNEIENFPKDPLDEYRGGGGGGGLVFPGWFCNCGIFNGEAKMRHETCRACGATRMEL